MSRTLVPSYKGTPLVHGTIMADALRITIFAFFVFTFTFSRPLIYAQDAPKNTAALVEENARLRAELKEMNYIRDKILKKLKTAPEENAKFKEGDIINNPDEGLRADTAITHYNLGVILQKANKWREAIKEYNEVLEILPNDADTNFNLALIYDTAKNDRAKAIYYYQRYLEATPSASDAAKVKERIATLTAENRVWGELHRGGIPEKTGRLW